MSNKDLYYFYYYHYFFIIIIITEVQFSDWTKTLCNKTKKAKEILPFVTAYNPATPNLKKVLMLKTKLVCHILVNTEDEMRNYTNFNDAAQSFLTKIKNTTPIANREAYHQTLINKGTFQINHM